MRIYMTVGGKDEFIVELSKFNYKAKVALRDSIVDWSNRIVQEAQIASPSFSGRLRSSIFAKNPETVKASGKGDQDLLVGYARSNLSYATFQEYGTGPMGAKTNRLQRPSWHDYHVSHKFPPWNIKSNRTHAGLGGWAASRGTTAFKVALGIFKAQGVRARPFLQPAFIRHREEIIRDMQNAVYSTVAATNAKFGKEIPTGFYGEVA